MRIGRWLALGCICFAALILTACGAQPLTYDSIVVNFVDTATPDQVATLADKYHIPLRLSSASDYAQAEALYLTSIDPSQRPRVVRKLLKALAAESLIESAEPNVLYTVPEPQEIYADSPSLSAGWSRIAAATPNDPMYGQQWNMEAIGLLEAWDITAGEGVTVAVIDTGVTQVPDLAQTRFVKGYDFVDDDENPEDLQGHGTHVAGTIAQSTHNAYGVVGIAYQSQIMPVRVLDANGSGTLSDVVEGIRYAADHGATVINMSLGARMPSPLMQEAVTYAHQKGVTVIAAAGNEGSGNVSYPGACEHVIGVSALGPTGEKAPYSNYGVGVDISAPGGAKTQDHPEWGVLQETINRRDPNKTEFAYYQGTSMATPHVAGVAALIQSQGVKDPDQVEKVLKLSATPVDNDKLNYFGAGRLNAQQAVLRSSNHQSENPLELWLKDFIKYLSDNGYLSPKFWFDGGAVMLVPKLIMVLGGYIVLILIRWWLAPRGLSLSLPLLAGMVLGSSGLFVLQGLVVMDLPRWPLQIMGSSLPEMGTAFLQTNALNPIFASFLLPLVAILLFLSHRHLRWLAIGLTAGVAAHLLLSGTLFYEGVLWFGSSAAWFGRSFLLLNGLLCLVLAYFASKAALSSSSSTQLAVKR